MPIILTEPIMIAGALVAVDGTTKTYNAAFEADQVAAGKAKWAPGSPTVGNRRIPLEIETTSDQGVKNGLIKIGKKESIAVPSTTPVVLIGGDHPVNQWWGRDGSDGLAGLYAKHGIVPYCAINTQSQTSEGVGDNYMMGWDKIRTLQSSGLVEFVSHGRRHINDHEAPDTGIQIKYTGSAVAASIYITATNIIAVTTGGVDDFNFDFATYPTLAQLVTAITATGKYTASYAKELAGTELSKYLLTIAVGNAKSVKTATSYGARFSVGGGIRIFWDSITTYCDSCVVTIFPTSLSIMRDGARIASFVLSAYTMSSLLAAVKALNPALVSVDAFAGTAITGLLQDQGGQPYCTGEEDATNLGRYLNALERYDARRRPAIITAGGVSPGYIRHRNMLLAKQDAAAQGVTLDCYCQSGQNFWSDMAAELRPGMYDHYRGNSHWGLVAPVAIPTHLAKNGFHTHLGLKGNYNGTDQVDMLVDSIIASKGFVVDLLIHAVQTDAAATDGSVAGSSGFYLDSFAIGADMDEPNFLYLLQRLAAARDAGLIRIVQQRDMAAIAAAALPPQNLLYNPTMVSRKTTTLKVTDNSGRTTGGWRINGFGMQAVSIVDGGLEFISNGTQATVLTQRVLANQGDRYRLGCRWETEGGQATNIQMRVQPAYGDWLDAVAGKPLTYIQSDAYSKPYGEVSFDVEIPRPRKYGNARVVSINAQPFDLSVNKNIQVLLEGTIGFDIDCSAGAANPSAVTAKEIATAINTAIAANTQFTAKSELHNVARAENGKVVLELARRQPYPINTGVLQVNAGSVASATNAIFSATTCLAYFDHAGETGIGWWPIDIAVNITAPAGTKIRILDPYVKPYNGGI